MEEGGSREVVKTSPHSLLSCFLAFSSSTAPLLPKARNRSKGANMKGMPEILFFSVPCLPALFVTDMEMLNPKYRLYLGCKVYPASSDFLSLFSFFFFSSVSSHPFIIMSLHPLLLPLSSSPQASR